MASLPSGILYFVASTFGASKTTTVVTNASEAVVTSVAHGFSNGDYVYITSGWGRLNGRSARIKGITTDTFTLEGIDTSDTTVYTAGSGIGSVKKVTAWTEITKPVSPQSSGGDPVKVDYQYANDDVRRSTNDGFNATEFSMGIDSDSFGGADYTVLKSLTDSQADTVLRLRFKNGAVLLFPCTLALNEMPSFQSGQIMTCPLQFSGTGRPVRYAA